MANNIQRPNSRQSRWGICTNPNCPNYSKKIEILRGDLICPEEGCKKPLSPCAPPHKKESWMEKYGKRIGIVIVVILILAGIGFGVYAAISGMGGSKIKAIKLDKKELKLKVGERELLTATPDPADAKATFIWKSSDKNVVDVVGGELTALKKGKATITVKVEENQELRAVTCKIEVVEAIDSTKILGGRNEVLITNLTLDSPNFSIKVGETKQLNFHATPEKNDESITWSTSDPKVATVSSSGLVSAIGAGTATITALSDKSMKEAIVKVTVTAKEGSLRLSYGTYTGQIKNGYPNGQGRLKYSTSRQINKYDSKGRMANPGDVVQGTFVNGFITIGKHYDASGNLIESLNIGTVDGVYEQK